MKFRPKDKSVYRINILFREKFTDNYDRFCCIVINSTVYCFTNYFKKPITKNLINTLVIISQDIDFKFNTGSKEHEEVLLDEISSFLDYWIGGSIVKYDKKRINFE